MDVVETLRFFNEITAKQLFCYEQAAKRIANIRLPGETVSPGIIQDAAH